MNAEVKIETGRNFGLLKRLLVLTAVMTVVGAIAILVAQWLQIVDVKMAVVAWLVCVISTQIAHVVGEYPSGDEFFMARLAASMFARTCLPFMVVLLAKLSDRIPFEPGFVIFVILFYLVGLLTDVCLQVMRSKMVG